MDGNTEHELVQRREGFDIHDNGRLLAAFNFWECCKEKSSIPDD